MGAPKIATLSRVQSQRVERLLQAYRCGRLSERALTCIEDEAVARAVFSKLDRCIPTTLFFTVGSVTLQPRPPQTQSNGGKWQS